MGGRALDHSRLKPSSIGLFRVNAMALNSQYPTLTLMVPYTVVSLWIIAQPIVA